MICKIKRFFITLVQKSNYYKKNSIYVNILLVSINNLYILKPTNLTFYFFESIVLV